MNICCIAFRSYTSKRLKITLSVSAHRADLQGDMLFGQVDLISYKFVTVQSNGKISFILHFVQGEPALISMRKYGHERRPSPGR